MPAPTAGSSILTDQAGILVGLALHATKEGFGAGSLRRVARREENLTMDEAAALLDRR